MQPSVETGTVKPGLFMWWTQTTAPDGWLICDGSQVSRTTYSDLFSVIGTTFGSGDGSTTFTLPDLRAAFVRGSGSKDSYSATFGQTQTGTNINVVTNSYPTTVNVYSSDGIAGRGNGKYTNWDSTSEGFMTSYYVRPYNIALTPVIKY